MKFKVLLSVLLIAALICPAILAEETIESPIVVSEESDHIFSVNTDIEEDTDQDKTAAPITQNEATLLASDADIVEKDADAREIESETINTPVEILVESVDEIVEEQSVDLLDESSTVIIDEPDLASLDAGFYEADNASSLEGMAEDSIIINDTYFPDANFRGYVAGLFYKNEGATLTSQELSEVKEIEVPQAAIDLRGIKYFSNLEILRGVGSNVTTLDLSGMTHLKNVNWYIISNNNDDRGELRHLDVSGCTNLETLWCDKNKLADLNINGCTNLKTLWCYNNQLTNLDTSGSTELKSLDCHDNLLTNLNTSGCTNLENLWCHNNQLTSLNVSGYTKLYSLYCSDNHLTSLNVTGCSKMRDLYCSHNQLTDLYISECTNLSQLFCYSNQITSLDIRNCGGLVQCLKCGKKENIGYSDGVSVTKYSDAEEGEEQYGLFLVVDPTLTIIYGDSVQGDSSPGDSSPGDSSHGDSSQGNTLSTSASPTVIPSTQKTTRSTIQVGNTYQIDLMGKTGKRFKSSKKKVATVSKTGIITPRKAGKTTITFKVDKKTRKIKLTVTDPTVPSSVSLNMSGTQTAKKGESLTITATVPEGTNSGFKWKSSNKKVATINANGVVTFKKKGKVTITCTAKRGGKKAKVKFKVTE